MVRPLHAVIRAMSNPKTLTVIDSSDLRRILKPSPVLAIHYDLPSSAEISNLSQNDSSLLSPLFKGKDRTSCIALIEAGRGQLEPQHINKLPEQLEIILGAQPREIKTLIARRPDSEKTYVTILVGVVTLYR